MYLPIGPMIISTGTYLFSLKFPVSKLKGSGSEQIEVHLVYKEWLFVFPFKVSEGPSAKSCPCMTFLIDRVQLGHICDLCFTPR